MLFSNVVTAFCFLSSTVALPILSPRDTTVPDQAFRRILGKMKPLDDAMKRIRMGVGDPGEQTVNLLALDWDLQQELKESAKSVRRIQELSMVEASSLLTTMSQLPLLATSIANGWIQWKPMVVAGQKEKDVRGQLKDDADALSEFADALNGKVPKVALIQGVGSTWKSSLTSPMEKAVKEYERR